MNYATQHHIGNYQPTRTKTATAVAPTIGRVRKLATKTKGRKPSAERQTEIRTDSNVANAILKWIHPKHFSSMMAKPMLR